MGHTNCSAKKDSYCLPDPFAQASAGGMKDSALLKVITLACLSFFFYWNGHLNNSALVQFRIDPKQLILLEL